MLSSGICMDKNISKKILRYEGIETPDWIELTKMEDLNLDELDKLGFPLVVKTKLWWIECWGENCL